MSVPAFLRPVAFFALACALCGPSAVLAATPFADALRAQQLVGSMQAALSASADLEKNAILTDSDEEAKAFSQKVHQRLDDLRKSKLELSALLASMKASKETALLAEFDKAFGEYDKLSDRILALAVQNSNDKATKLSKERGLTLLADLEESLSSLCPADASSCPLRADADGALIAVLKIQTLLAPHIAEIDEKVMDGYEASMKVLEAKAKDHLTRLKTLADAAKQPAVLNARKILDEYSVLTQEIVKLSRQNTDVESLALSLGQKRQFAAACADSLDALQAALAARGPKATR